MVTFALEAEHSIRTGMNTAVDHAGEMNAQKWKLGIRHRINQVSHKISAFGL